MKKDKFVPLRIVKRVEKPEPKQEPANEPIPHSDGKHIWQPIFVEYGQTIYRLV